MSGQRGRTSLGAAIDLGAGTVAEHAHLVDRADEPADYSGWLQRWLWPSLLLVGGTAGLYASGVELWRAAALSVGMSLALWAVIATMAVPDMSWHEDVPGRQYRPTSTWEVAGLAAARESDDAFARHLRPRLWSLTETLLERRGIDPGSDRAREVVGPAHYALLTGEDTDPRRMTGAVSALCHTVARLAVAPLPEGAPPVASPSLSGLAGAGRTRLRADQQPFRTSTYRLRPDEKRMTP